MKYILILLVITACTVHPRNTAINRWFIVSEINGDYIRVYSPSTPQALTHLDFVVHYPNPIKVGDTLIVDQKSRYNTRPIIQPPVK